MTNRNVTLLAGGVAVLALALMRANSNKNVNKLYKSCVKEVKHNFRKSMLLSRLIPAIVIKKVIRRFA